MDPSKIRVHKLEVENFKRVRAVTIAFPEGGGTIEICGSNAQGKTSTVSALWACLGGQKACPEQPIRTGERRAFAELDLGELRVRREWWPTGTKLIVTERDGFPPKSPQAILDSLFNRLAFDPLEFTRMKATEQAKILREMTGLDFRALDEKRAQIFAERTDVNRAVKSQEAKVAEMPSYPGMELVSISALTDQLFAMEHANVCHDRLIVTRDHQQNRVDMLTQEIERLTAERLDATRELEKTTAALRNSTVVDSTEIRAKIADAETINRQARAEGERQAAVEELRANRAHAEDLTFAIEDIDTERQAILAATPMPVAGLSLDGETVLFHSIPFDQVSTSEQIRVSLAMAARLNSTLRLVIIREGSLLDENSLRMVAEWAETNDYQVIVERVADSVAGENGVVIEEGEVVETVNAESPKRPKSDAKKKDLPNNVRPANLGDLRRFKEKKAAEEKAKRAAHGGASPPASDGPDATPPAPGSGLAAEMEEWNL